MRPSLLIIMMLLIVSSTYSQSPEGPPQAKIMTLGVFHFAYPNLDAVKTDESNQISVLDEPWQGQIRALCTAIAQFRPTRIAIEQPPDQQARIDSLFQEYKAGRFGLKKNEIYQLGFRLAKELDLDRVYCVDDPGQHYDHITAIFQDPDRRSRFEEYYLNARDTLYEVPRGEQKVSSIVEALYESNRPEVIKEGLATYLLHPFKYEEQPGDFTGVDFESGRWYNRNLRIFRNIQRVTPNSDERVLLIIGSAHLNLLNQFFDASREFELVSPLPYLETLR